MARKTTTPDEPTIDDAAITPDAAPPQPPAGGPPPDMAGTAAATPAERHGWWRFAGARDQDGSPLEYFPGIPARDLAPQDVAGLDDERYGLVDVSRLYERGEEPPPDPGGANDEPPDA